MTDLQPCSECHRHVRSSDATCPFCSTAITPAAPPRLPVGRITRAAVFAGALAASATACGSGQTQPADPPPATSDAQISNIAPDTTADAGVPVAEPLLAADAAPLPDYDYPLPNKPYGAPPARTRLV